MPGPVHEADQQHMNQMVQEFTTEETLDQAYKQQARRFEPGQQEMATQSVARSSDQNVLVGFALRNAASLNLDVSQTARLKSIKGRNLANIIMNTPGYRRENPELDRIKEKTAVVERMLDNKLGSYIKEDVQGAQRNRNIAEGSTDVRIAYQDAILACKDYMEKHKIPKSDRAIAEHNNVVSHLGQLVDEYNRLYMAQQRLFRGQIGGEDADDMTIRDLFLEQERYAAEHPFVTKEEADAFRNKDVAKRSIPGAGVPSENDFNNSPKLKFFFNTLIQKGLPDAMAAGFGDKETAVSYLKEIYDIISGFKKDKLISWTFVIDDMVVNLFQQEDGSLEFGYDKKIGQNYFPYRTKLPSNAHTLLATMGANMVENDGLFGKQWVEQTVMSSVEDSSIHTERERQAVDNDLSSAYLRKELGVQNIELTNIPADDRIRLAKRLISGEETKRGAQEFIKYYEYGGHERKTEKRQEKREKVKKLNDELKIYEDIAHGGGFKNMQEMVDRKRNGAPLPEDAAAYEKILDQQLEAQIAENNTKVQYYNSTVFIPPMNAAMAEKTSRTERLAQVRAEFEAVSGQLMQQAQNAEDNNPPQDLLTRKEELLQEMGTLNDEITSCDGVITSLLQQRNDNLARITEETNEKLGILSREMGFFREWKEYYALLTSINMPTILSFQDWKVRMMTDREEWEKDNERAKNVRTYYDNIIEEYLKLENDYKSAKYEPLSSLSMDRINGEDTLELLRHRKNMEQAGRLKEMVVFTSEAKEERREKAKGIIDGTEWTEKEEEMKNLIADFICSDKTWDMDTSTDPGVRLFSILEQHQGLVSYMAGDPKRFEDFLKGVVKKLPLQIMELEEKDVTEPVLKLASAVRGEALKEVQRQRREFEEREREREERREAKRRALAIKRKQGASRAEIDEEYRKLKSGIFKKRSFFSRLSNFLGFGAAEAAKERIAEEEFRKALDEIDKAGTDVHSLTDNLYKIYDDHGLMAIGVSQLFGNKRDEEKRAAVARNLAEAERRMTELMQKQIGRTESILKKYVEANFGADNAPRQRIEKVKYYRDNNISAEERLRRESQGAEQLEKMLKNSLFSKEGQGQYFRNILTEYIPRSSTIDIRYMLSSAIRNARPVKLPKNAKEAEKTKALNSYVGGLFKGAGPLMQKVLQGFPPDMIPAGMESAFEDVKSDLAPIPREIVEAQMLSIIERSGGSIQKIEIQRSLGAASIGQAFLCKVYGTKSGEEDVVIKILRPDVRNRMLREEKIMRRCARNAGKGMLKTFDGQMKRYKEELDLTIEAKNCELGKVYDLPDSNVKAMKISRIAPPTPNVLMVKRATGDTVVDILKRSKARREEEARDYFEYNGDGSRVLGADEKPKMVVKKGTDVREALSVWLTRLTELQRQKQLLDKMAGAWVSEAIFGSGFYHGDLHAGNIMIDDGELTAIDFGNATKLSSFQQDKVLLMTLAAAAGDSKGFLDGFGALLGDDSRTLFDEKKNELQEIFTEVMHLGTFTNSAERIGAALVRAQELGFELPGAIYGFQQCQMRLQNTINDFKKEVEEVQLIVRGLVDVYNGAAIKLKTQYHDDVSRNRLIGGGTMKFVLLPSEREDILKMLHTDTPEEEQQVIDFFDDMFADIDKLVEMPDKLLEPALYGGAEAELFGRYEGLVTREQWKSILDDGETVFTDTIQEDVLNKKSAPPQVSKEAKERRPQKLEDLRNYFRAINVPEVLKRLQDARKNNLPAEQIEALENEAADKILKAREVHLAAKPMYARREIAKIVQDPGEAEQFYQREVESRFHAETYWEKFKQKARNPEKIRDIEEEVGIYANDRQFGEEIRNALAAWKNAHEQIVQDPNALEQAINNLTKALTIPVLKTFGNSLKVPGLRKTSFIKAKDFVNIMGKVVEKEWKDALKKLKDLSYLTMLDYARKIKGDIEHREVGYKEIILEFIRS